MQILIRNEMGQKLVLTEELFLEILSVAEKQGWCPMGTGEVMSSQPSISDYLPRGIEGYRTIAQKDAIGICVALRVAQAEGVTIYGTRSSLENDVEEDQAAPEDLMPFLLKFFQRGWVVVYRWKD